MIAAVAMTATLPGRTHGLGLITEALINDPIFAVACWLVKLPVQANESTN